MIDMLPVIALSITAYYPLVMKMAEDTILHHVTQGWKDVYNYFDVIYKEELALCPE